MDEKTHRETKAALAALQSHFVGCKSWKVHKMDTSWGDHNGVGAEVELEDGTRFRLAIDRREPGRPGNNS